MRQDQAKAINELNADPTIRTAGTGGPIRWESYRTLDPIRAAALQAAVGMIPNISIQSTAERIDFNVDPSRVIANARQFERYLTGEEADESP